MSPRADASVGSALAWSALLAAVAFASLGGAEPSASEEIRVPRHRVDLASAASDEIAMLPGIGPGLASRIVAARARRPFGSIEDLARIEGVGDATLERIRGDAELRGLGAP